MLEPATMASSRRGPDPRWIRDVFTAIADRYDLANTILSAGIHHRWRRSLVRWSAADRGQKVLDCAAGTGDQALAFTKAVGPTGIVVACDFCWEMLSHASRKAHQRKGKIRVEQADVLRLPHAAGSFHIASISFGLRNVSDPIAALAEMGRVTRPGGTVMVLEFGRVSSPLFRSVFRLFSQHVLPRVGAWVAGDAGAYQYLRDSADSFPCGEEFLHMITQVPILEGVRFRNLAGGIAYMYKAQVR